MTEKLLTYEKLSQNWSSGDETICFVSGNFNIIHPGHLRFLMFAAEQADILVVGLNDKRYSAGAFLSNEERLLGLNALSFIKHIVIIEDDLEQVIKTIKPQVIVKGKEFEGRENIEFELAKSCGGKLLFSSGERTFSSKALLLAEAKSEITSTQAVKSFLTRNHIEFDEIKKTVEEIRNLKVTIIGDIIVDEYQECLPIGMSQEDPTIAVSPIESFKFLGGAGIVAAHASGLGAEVQLLSVVGNDQLSDFVMKKLSEYEIGHHVTLDKTRPTTHKLRYRAKDKTLLRVNNYRKHNIEDDVIDEVFGHFIKNSAETNLVVFSDFNYGLLCPKLVKQISDYCLLNRIPMVADSQTSSQLGDLNKFKNILLTTPTEVEARGAMSDENSGLAQICTDLGNRLRAQNVIITLGSEGILIHHQEESSWETDRLPALTSTAIDTAGAGDALYVTTALALASGASIWQAAFLGSISAAIQVNVKGNKPIKGLDLLGRLETLAT